MFDQNEKTEEETLAGTHAVHSEGIKEVTNQMKNFFVKVLYLLLASIPCWNN